MPCLLLALACISCRTGPSGLGISTAQKGTKTKAAGGLSAACAAHRRRVGHVGPGGRPSAELRARGGVDSSLQRVGGTEQHRTRWVIMPSTPSSPQSSTAVGDRTEARRCVFSPTTGDAAPDGRTAGEILPSSSSAATPSCARSHDLNQFVERSCTPQQANRPLHSHGLWPTM